MTGLTRLTCAAFVAAVASATSCGGSGLDANGTKACDLVAQIDGGKDAGLFSGAVDELATVEAARKSSNGELRAAANTKSPAADLDPGNPLYENPGDVQFNAVAAWCRVHH